jgi:para-nitrobenzyl esterase
MDIVVKTSSGAVRGARHDGIYCFKGLAYAAAPIGSLRFAPPAPCAPWHGVREALAFGAKPLQPRMAPDVEAMLADPSVVGDDCLNLNIWSGALGEARMPIMVWIPGGAFELGSAASYDGARFARDGVVCVAINYRVGAEGFAYLAPGQANFGLQDQIAALVWVKQNIRAFGGDPDNVTIFGESAGAMSIGALLAAPSARGLFRRAILQSGGAQAVTTPANAIKATRALAAKLGVEASRAGLAGTRPERLLAAQSALKQDILVHPDPALWGEEAIASLMPFQPVIDGEILPAAPLARIAAGASDDVAMMAGFNSNDWRIFLFANGVSDIPDETLLGPVAAHGFKCLAAYGLAPGPALAAYRALQTDWWCRIPALRLAEARAHAPTYLYEFAWRSPAAGGLFGACHGLEMPFVFDTLDKGAAQIMGPLLGPAPPQELADAMHTAWLSFARSGDPGWPAYEHKTRSAMLFAAPSRIVQECCAWEGGLWQGVR